MLEILLSKTLPKDFMTPASNDGSSKTLDVIEQVNEQIKGYGGSTINLFMTAFIFIVTIGLIILGFKIMKDAGNPQKTAEYKSAFMMKVGAIVLGAAAIGLVIFLWDVGSNLLPAIMERQWGRELSGLSGQRSH